MQLHNEIVTLEFSPDKATLTALHNHLTGETYRITGDGFALECREGKREFADFRLVSRQLDQDSLVARYRAEGFDVDITYRLGGGRAFAEKVLTVSGRDACGLMRVVLSAMDIQAPNLRITTYRHPNFDRIYALDPWKPAPRPAGTEPVRTFFGRTSRGGFFAGVETAFDQSRLEAETITLALAPNMKLAAGEALTCEPAYLGVYRRSGRDERADECRAWRDPSSAELPLPSESAAMRAMTAALFGPPRHGLMVTACGWHSEMEQHTYSEASLAGDLGSLEFLRDCGVAWVTDSHPWGGETEKMNNLQGDDRYQPGPAVMRLLDHSRRVGVNVVQWTTLNGSHPWWWGVGQPFRRDRPDWLRGTEKPAPADVHDFRNLRANCLADREFQAWLGGIALQAIEAGQYRGWCVDGDFWGYGGYYHSTIPVTCLSDEHDHLVPDANYACQRALDRLIAQVRARHPNLYIVACRPPEDLGVWANRHVDACFTLIETGGAACNLATGDEIRTCSRIRVHHHFFPHHLDWPLLFPSYAGYSQYAATPENRPAWPSRHIDYVLLSAMSCSPNLLLYLPSKTGIPEADKAELRRWLRWGRDNQAFLQVRHDLPQWPRPDRVDGSAHMLGGQGLIFLFNSSDVPLPARVAVTPECLGEFSGERFQVRQEHPPSADEIVVERGRELTWQVPARTALVLRLLAAS